MAYVFVFINRRRDINYDTISIKAARNIAIMLMVAIEGRIITRKKKQKLKVNANGVTWYEKMRRIPPVRGKRFIDNFDESIYYFE